MRCARGPRFVAWMLGLSLMAGIVGCGGDQKKAASAPAAAASPAATEVAATVGDTASPAALESTEPPTDAECSRFGQVLADAINANDLNKLNQLVDWPALLAAATEGIPAPAELHKTFQQEALASLDQESGFWPQIINQAGAGNADIARFLHLHGTGDRRAVLIRVVLPESVTYLDVAVARRGGQLRGADIFSFLSGEFVSQSIRRAYVVNAATQDPAVVQKLKNWERDLAASLAALETMTASLPAKPADWLAGYAKLPESLQKDKNIMLTRIDVAKQASDEAFAAAVTDFKTVHAADPSTDLVLLNLYALAQQHPEVLATLERLDTFVGGDPYLKVWKGNALLMLNKPVEARAQVTAAIKQEPTLRHGYWALVMISLAERQFNETVSLLDGLEQNFKVELDDLSRHPEYAEFLRSPEYRAWARTRAAQVPATNSLR